MNYSQGDEQRHIIQACGPVGHFLDIGAWHAKNLSNTRGLYELPLDGWSGVLVEPSPEPFLGLLKEYGDDPRIDLLCAAVGLSEGIAKFHATADALTTSSRENYEKWKAVGGFYGIFYAPVVTLEMISALFGEFDFISIDAEGTSVELFKRALEIGMRPKCFCVEHDNQNVLCIEMARAAGYREVYFSGENQVFAR